MDSTSGKKNPNPVIQPVEQPTAKNLVTLILYAFGMELDFDPKLDPVKI
jgi:hypothetical protein